MFGLAKKIDNQVFFIIIKREIYSQLVQKYNIHLFFYPIENKIEKDIFFILIIEIINNFL